MRRAFVLSDRDRRPDLVRVSRSGVDVLHNDSDAQGIRFTALPRFEWSQEITLKVTWLDDLDGDGNIDVVIRSSSGLWVLFGLGHNRWTTTPKLFHFVTLRSDTLGSFDTYQVTFVDANKDGLADVLVTKGTNVWLYTNRGDSFHEVPVAGFRNVQSSFGLPIVAYAWDSAGRVVGKSEWTFRGSRQVSGQPAAVLALRLCGRQPGQLRGPDRPGLLE